MISLLDFKEGLPAAPVEYRNNPPSCNAARLTVMPNTNDDDYVARLLAEDAKKSSLRYAAFGLSALLPQRPTKAAPKPNTRFLNHIVREADSHNAALKKKEELEARTRLREMRNTERYGGVGDEGDGGRERKRRRIEVSRNEEGRLHTWEQAKDRGRSASPSERRRCRDDERSGRSRRHEEERRDRRRSHRHRSYSPKRTSKTPKSSISLRRSSHHHRSSQKPSRPKPSPPPSLSRLQSPSGSTLSDPLDSLIGPHPSKLTPPIHTRGRGTSKPTSKSNIDLHFSSTYDPNRDTHPSSDSDDGNPASSRGVGDDWDMALEALRDRTMWKQKQSERMREAGFEEEEIRRWEKTSARALIPGGSGGGNVDGDVRDVKWARKGEAREWDLGKKSFDKD